MHREIRHIVPILAAHLQYIDWPPAPPTSSFEGMFIVDQVIFLAGNSSRGSGVVGAIDCTSHFRVRSLNAATYYRGDKAGYFLSAQIVCALDGVIYDVSILKGHNNDISK